MQPYDRSSNWLLKNHGDAILRLAKLENVTAWRVLPNEVVQPRRLPDGLLEVRLATRDEPICVIAEIATYPDRRITEQVLRDAMLVYLERGALPEVVVVVLQQRGAYRVGGSEPVTSSLGWTTWQITWKVVELWTLSAEELLAANDVGLIPWIPLTQFSGPPEQMLEMCRQRIETQAPASERENLLAVTHVLAGLRYNDPGLRNLLWRTNAMIESPVIQELMAEQAQTDIRDVLMARFGSVPSETDTALRAVPELERLRALNRWAATCPDLDAFHTRLTH